MLKEEYIKVAAEKLATRIAPIYKLLNWKWSTIGEVPNKDQIKETLMELTEDYSQEPYEMPGSFGTGGLQIRRYKDEEQHIHYELEFHIREEIRTW